ncbi:MAG: FecR domain-containing protein [Eubacteriales bacterium]|nr:FecR domain-containing protein [Eubacteriales bacterium]
MKNSFALCKFRIKRLVSLLTVICLISAGTFTARADITADASMRLSRTEGTVSVTNKTGKNASIINNMKLFDGYGVSTDASSYAWITLDDSKAVKLDAVSAVSVAQEGKKLELKLNSGNLFFNVDKPLQEDETLNIRSSTMVTGIRGTSGVVRIIDSTHSQIQLFDGTLEISAADPVSGEMRTTRLTAGNRADININPSGTANNRCSIIIDRMKEEEVPGFAAMEIKNNSSLANRIAGSGLNVGAIINDADNRLRNEKNRTQQKMNEIKSQASQQGLTTAGAAPPVVNSVFGGTPSADSDSGSGSGSGSGSSGSGGTSDTQASDPTLVTLPMPVTASELQTALNTYSQVNVTGSGELVIDNGVLSIGSSNTLILDSSIGLTVAAGNTVNNDGHLEAAGGITNNGTMTNTSMNTLIAGGNGLMSSGSFENTGKLQGNVTVNAGAFHVSAGTFSGSLTVAGGIADITGGFFSDCTLSAVGGNSEVNLTGGSFDGCSFSASDAGTVSLGSETAHPQITSCTGKMFELSNGGSIIYSAKNSDGQLQPVRFSNDETSQMLFVAENDNGLMFEAFGNCLSYVLSLEKNLKRIILFQDMGISSGNDLGFGQGVIVEEKILDGESFWYQVPGSPEIDLNNNTLSAGEFGIKSVSGITIFNGRIDGSFSFLTGDSPVILNNLPFFEGNLESGSIEATNCKLGIVVNSSGSLKLNGCTSVDDTYIDNAGGGELILENNSVAANIYNMHSSVTINSGSNVSALNNNIGGKVTINSSGKVINFTNDKEGYVRINNGATVTLMENSGSGLNLGTIVNYTDGSIKLPTTEEQVAMSLQIEPQNVMSFFSAADNLLPSAEEDEAEVAADEPGNDKESDASVGEASGSASAEGGTSETDPPEADAAEPEDTADYTSDAGIQDPVAADSSTSESTSGETGSTEPETTGADTTEQAAAGKNTLEQKSTDGLSENGGDDQSGDPASPAGSSANPIPEAYPAAQSNGEETVTGKEE